MSKISPIFPWFPWFTKINFPDFSLIFPQISKFPDFSLILFLLKKIPDFYLFSLISMIGGHPAFISTFMYAGLVKSVTIQVVLT